MDGTRLAALFALVCSFFALSVSIAGFVVFDDRTDTRRTLETREQIYSCMIDRYWEDGSSASADAEAAVACMRETGVYQAFLADYVP